MVARATVEAGSLADVKSGTLLTLYLEAKRTRDRATARPGDQTMKRIFLHLHLRVHGRFLVWSSLKSRAADLRAWLVR